MGIHGSDSAKELWYLSFCTTVSPRDAFDPQADSTHGLLGEQDDGPTVEDPQVEEEGT